MCTTIGIAYNLHTSKFLLYAYLLFAKLIATKDEKPNIQKTKNKFPESLLKIETFMSSYGNDIYFNFVS